MIDIEPKELLDKVLELYHYIDEPYSGQKDIVMSIFDKIPADTMDIIKTKIEFLMHHDFTKAEKLWDEQQDKVEPIEWLRYKIFMINATNRGNYRDRDVRSLAEDILKLDPNDIHAKEIVINFQFGREKLWRDEKELKRADLLNEEIINSETATEQQKIEALRRKIRRQKDIYENDEAGLTLATYYLYKRIEAIDSGEALELLITSSFELKLYAECLTYIEKYLKRPNFDPDSYLGNYGLDNILRIKLRCERKLANL